MTQSLIVLRPSVETQEPNMNWVIYSSKEEGFHKTTKNRCIGTARLPIKGGFQH